MQGLLERVTEIAEKHNAKNQAMFVAANLDPFSMDGAQQLNRSSLVSLYLMTGIDRSIAEAIVDVEIINSR